MGSLEQAMSLEERGDSRARDQIVQAIEWLSTIDSEPVPSRVLIFDEATFLLECVMPDPGASILLGDVLWNEAEKRAVDGVRSALLCMYKALGNGPLTYEFVAHPFILSVACTASWALNVLLAEIKPTSHS